MGELGAEIQEKRENQRRLTERIIRCDCGNVIKVKITDIEIFLARHIKGGKTSTSDCKANKDSCFNATFT